MSFSRLSTIWTICVLLLVNLLNYMDRYTLAGILPEIQDKNRNGFHVSVDDKEAGFLQTSFILSFMVFSPIFGYLGDRYTRKYLMATGLFIWAGFVLVGSFSTNYGMLVATRCMVGIGEASYATIAPTIIADLFPAEKRLRVLSLFYMAIPIGSAIGYAAGSVASSVAHKHFNVQYSWKWGLRISPGLGILAVLLILFTVKEPSRGGEDPRRKSSVKGESGFSGYIKDLASLAKNHTFILTTLGFAALTFAVGALAQWAPTLVWRTSKLLAVWEHTKPYKESFSSSLFGVITVCAGLCGTLAGSEMSKFISRWTKTSDSIVCALGLLVCSPILFLALTLGNYNMYLSWILVFLGEVSLCLTWAPVAAILLYVVPPERRSTAEAVQILVTHLLGDAASPTITGAISDKIESILSRNYDDIYSKAISMQYALYTTTFVAVIGGGFFLWSTLTVEKDRKDCERQIRESHILNKDSTAVDHQSLNSDIPSNGVYEQPRVNIMNNENDPGETDKLIT